jgi:hypothetical protein
LSFSVQIFIRSKQIDISSYLKLLDDEYKKCQNMLLKNHIKLYSSFVQELVKTNIVLDKKFYIVIPYSQLEGGIGIGMSRDNLYLSAKAKLSIKADSLHSMLHRMNLQARTLDKEELVKLFYEIYNGDFDQIGQIIQNTKYPMVKRGVT